MGCSPDLRAREDVLPYLDKIGIRPGVKITIKEIAPMDGPVTIGTDEGSVAIGRELAAMIRLRGRRQPGLEA